MIIIVKVEKGSVDVIKYKDGRLRERRERTKEGGCLSLTDLVD